LRSVSALSDSDGLPSTGVLRAVWYNVCKDTILKRCVVLVSGAGEDLRVALERLPELVLWARGGRRHITNPNAGMMI
jgi:hypothetical protein